MKFPLRGHGRLFFRTYLQLVAALLAVAVGLQFAYDRLQKRAPLENDPWIEATLALVTARLERAAPGERDAIAASLGETLGMNVQLLDRDQVAADGDVTLEALVDEHGDTWYLHAPAALDELVYIGPVNVPEERLVTKLVPVFFYLSIVILVGVWLRPILKDINTMTAAAQHFAADYRTPLSTSQQTTQLTDLARDLDEMSSRLSGLIQNQKELIAALSHEMRTPLARIRFALAVLGNGADDNLAGKLAAINHDVQEIDELVATMLNYARLDHPDLQMNWQAVPLEPWLEQATEKFAGLDKPLALELTPGLDSVKMDPRLMALAVSNLLSNAQRHAETRFRLAVRAPDGDFEIAVDDDGPGVPESERGNVFKAFKRLDDSRSRETGGFGLGLAVVARIAALHGGTARVETSAGLGGASFVIRWPTPAW